MKRGAIMGELTLKTIIQGFINAENEFPKHMQKRIFSLSDKYAKNSNTRCKAVKANNKEFFDFWIPESFVSCFGNAGSGLTYDQVCHIMAGRKKKVEETLQDQLEECPIQMFWDFKEHIEKALEQHIKVYVCIKHNGPSIFDGEKVGITVKDLTGEILTKTEVYEKTLKAFKKVMLESILNSDEYINDKRISESKFYELLIDEKRDEIERLTTLSIFGLFASVTVENENYYFNSIYKKIYDEKTNKLKLRPKTKEQQIKIDREAIWKAGKNWYEQTKKEGNRFSKLFPDTALLPLAGTIPIYVHSTENKEKPLMDTIRETSGHLYLIGEGGIGKTTALYSIMEDAYVNCEEQINQQVPLFIELSRAYDSKDFDIVRGRSKFIRSTVQNQLQNSLKTNVNLEMQIEEEFKKDTDEPEYVLLLDGLNEVSREEIRGHVILQLVVAEIIYIMANFKNVRVILTSRSEENLDAASTSFYLSGIATKQIKIYLKEKKISKARIKEAIANTQLKEILRIPLFLIMYAELDENVELLSRGEILHAFFSKANKERYSEKNRIKTINSEFAKETGIDRSEGSKNCITPHMLNFILDFIMPQIAWNMAKENEFQIKRAGIKKAVKQVLTDKTETSFISEYGIDFFCEYLTGEDENIRATAERIMKVFGEVGSGGKDSFFSGVLKCLTKQFGLLVTNDYKEYEVLHQHIRDYFAALYHINKLKLAAYINEQGDRTEAIECLSELAKEPLPGQILMFIGEALGELHNVPELNEETNEWIKKEPERGTERDLINRCFDIFRGISDGKYAVWNLFQILKLVREDLSGTDFSGLDLRRCRANGYRLGNQTFAVKLDNSILTDEFFMPVGHSNSVVSVVYSPDGKSILSASKDGTAKVWDAKSFTEVLGGTLAGHRGGLNSAQYSPDGKHIVTASYDGTAKVWDAETFKEIPGGTLEGYDEVIYSAQYSPDGKYIVTASEDGTSKIWDAKTFTAVSGGNLIVHHFGVSSAQYSPDGKHIVTASFDGTAKVWDAETFKVIPGGVLAGHKDALTSVRYSPNGKYIVTTSYDKTAKVWDAETFKEIPGGTLAGHISWVHSVAYSPDGKTIVTVSEDKTAKVWDANSFKEILGGMLVGHKEALNSVQYSPDGKHLATASNDRSVKVWDAKTYKEIPGGTLAGHISRVKSVAYSPDGKNIVTGFFDGTARVWNTETFKADPCGLLAGHKDEVTSVQYSPDGKYIATSSDDRTVKVWDAKTLKEIPGGLLVGHKDRITTVRFSPDGKNIVTASYDKTAKVWDLNTFKEVPGGILTCDNYCVKSAEYSPDGKNIMLVSEKGTVKIWDAKSFEEVSGGTIHIDVGWFISAAYSPDGKYIVAVYDYGEAKIWNANTLKEVQEGILKGHTGFVESVVYSPDGKYIVTTSMDRTAKIWNANTLKEVQGGTLEGHTGFVESVVYSPDGKFIVTTSYDGTIKVWDAVYFKEIHTINYIPGLEACNVNVRELNASSLISNNTKKILQEYGAVVD